MKIIYFAIILAVAAADKSQYQYQSLEVPEDPSKWVFKGEAREGRISGGWQADDTQFPWTAQMGINLQSSGLRCTGSLIKENWILSARHCIADTNAVSVQASLGSADSNNFRVQVFSDQFVWLNSPDGNHPDIALFRLTQNLALSAYVNVVRLPSWAQENFKFEGYTMAASGWGGTGSGFPRFLQWTYFTVLYASNCNLGTYLMCSQTTYGGSSLEGGDSGGPSVIYENNVPTQIGVNVVVVTSGSNKWQGSTRVSSFLGFIRDVTGLVIRNN